nr:hypothetical protein [Clostridia bacterium]
MAKLNGADYLLLLLYLNNKKPIYGAIRLEKMMFLFKEEIMPMMKKPGTDSAILPEFIAYNFGPFSKDVYEQIELFKGIRFVQVTDLKSTEEFDEADDWEELPYDNEFSSKGYARRTDGCYYKYSLLKLGSDYVEAEIIPNVTRNDIEILEKFKERITALYPKQLLKYVYTKYPEYTTESLIKDEVLDDD